MLVLSKNQIKNIAKLHRKKQRELQQCFIVEGEKMVEEAINSDFEIIQIYCTERTKKDAFRTDSVAISVKEMSQITMLHSPSPALAIIRMKKTILDLELIANQKAVVLDSLRDPGNLGTIIRTAEWFGIKNMVLANDCVELYNPKVLQSSMGSFFRMNFLEITTDKLLQFKDQNRHFKLIGACLSGKPSKYLRKIDHGALVIGNEANGISGDMKDILDESVHIAGFGGAESLNAAMAAGILMHNWTNPQS